MRKRNLSAAAIFLIDIPFIKAQALSVHWNQGVAASSRSLVRGMDNLWLPAPRIEIGPALPASPGVLDISAASNLFT
jgi:hypothetical protein